MSRQQRRGRKAEEMAHFGPGRFIVQQEGVCGGSPVIKGTRVRVSDVVRYSNLMAAELIVDRIVEALPHLTPAQVRAALTYYEGHRNEIDSEIGTEEEAASAAWAP